MLWTSGAEPSHYVGNILAAHGLARHVRGPISRAAVRASEDYRGAQPLIADHREIRSVHNRAGLRAAAAVRSMTRRAVSGIHMRAALRIAG